MAASGRKTGRKAKRAGGNEVKNGMVAINAAVEFVEAANGIEAARGALGTVKEIGKIVK